MKKTIIAFKNETPLPGGDFFVILAEAPEGQEVKRQHWVSRRQFKRRGNAIRHAVKLIKRIAYEEAIQMLGKHGLISSN